MEIKKLLSEQECADIVYELAKEISRDFKNKKLTIVCVLNGGMVLTAFLRKQLFKIGELDFTKIETVMMKSSSYKGTRRVKKPVITETSNNTGLIQERDILIVEDIIDSGNTLKAVHERVESYHPKSIATCVLLDKIKARKVKYIPEYIGHVLKNKKDFIVGMGLDHNGQYRELPYVGVLHE